MMGWLVKDLELLLSPAIFEFELQCTGQIWRQRPGLMISWKSKDNDQNEGECATMEALIVPIPQWSIQAGLGQNHT